MIINNHSNNIIIIFFFFYQSNTVNQNAVQNVPPGAQAPQSLLLNKSLCPPPLDLSNCLANILMCQRRYYSI